jgi:hypothetical protein
MAEAIPGDLKTLMGQADEQICFPRAIGLSWESVVLLSLAAHGGFNA